ncbi:hypothetical protein [Eggerthella sp. YY7918]|uniref:hypothetical protein n=1 Tax=Eggerthella sp. (strain YY7918) TaxID=502558 RepID=UPI000217118F|nr:hypothetical protein [Eggerthella sp. YY7918]BAK45760.1 hypothetical protein EGYY_27680 [Eggerthella sp. YY7918]
MKGLMTGHTNVLPGVFVATLALVLALAVGCAPKEASSEKADTSDKGDLIQVTWSAESDCESCHTTEAGARTDETTLHAQHAEDACISCHDDEQTLASAHKDYAEKDPAVKLKKTKVASETCLTSGCHDQAEIAAATASETALTDTKGKVVNPHDLPVHDDHVKGVTCASCHKMHGAGTAEVDAVYKASKATCLSCHHNEVYECHTCHT